MKFAVVSAWPEIKNAEYEIIERIKISAKKLNVECIVVDNEGFVIGDTDKKTGQLLSGHEVEFVIALHFITEKLYNAYIYGAMWNPPKFLEDWGYETESNKYYTYDDYLIYGSRKIDGHLENLLIQTDKDITECLHFMTTVPGKPIAPKLIDIDDIKLFYSGINWERISNSKGRHHDLFKALDDEKLTRIYGPEKFFDAIPWDGFKTYSGSLPFDGISAIKAISECGASLVLTSDVHREAEAVSSRLFESCAAGVVLICDDNPYIIREFGDSVLYIRYDKNNYQNNVNQIKEHLNWIKNNREIALELAKKSQQIFVEKFHMDKVLDNIFKNHNARKSKVIEQNCDTEKHVSIILRLINLEQSLISFMQSLNSQYNVSKIQLVIVCNNDIKNKVEKIINLNLSTLIEFKIIGIKLYENDKRFITQGSMLVEGLKNCKYDLVSILDTNALLFDDHLALCAKQFQDNNISMAYSGVCAEDYLDDGNIKRSKIFFGNHSIHNITNFVDSVELSSIMFKKDSFKDILNHIIMLDGKELYSLMIASFLNGEWKFSYKVTLSISLKNGLKNKIENIVEDEWQKKLIRDAFKYNHKIINITNPNLQYIDISNTDLKQFEILLKNFVKSKIVNKYPKLLRFIKIIYNKVVK